MDVIVEYIVKRKNTGKDLALQILTVIAALMLFLLLMTAAFAFPTRRFPIFPLIIYYKFQNLINLSIPHRLKHLL